MYEYLRVRTVLYILLGNATLLAYAVAEREGLEIEGSERKFDLFLALPKKQNIFRFGTAMPHAVA
jgi:hypothetical protein